MTDMPLSSVGFEGFLLKSFGITILMNTALDVFEYRRFEFMLVLLVEPFTKSFQLILCHEDRVNLVAQLP